MHWFPVRIGTSILSQIRSRNISSVRTSSVDASSRSRSGEPSRFASPTFSAHGSKRSEIGCWRLVWAFFALTLLIIQDAKAQKLYELGRPLYQFFSTREYGGDNQNWSAVQDREGLVFLAITAPSSTMTASDGTTFRWPGAFQLPDWQLTQPGPSGSEDRGNWEISCGTETASGLCPRKRTLLCRPSLEGCSTLSAVAKAEFVPH